MLISFLDGLLETTTLHPQVPRADLGALPGISHHGDLIFHAFATLPAPSNIYQSGYYDRKGRTVQDSPEVRMSARIL